MDIDNLKSTWKALQNQPEIVLKDEQIHKLLQGKATDTVSKIKRSILIEGGLTLALSAFLLLNKNWFYSDYILSYLSVVMVLCLFWYAFKYIQVRKIDLEKNLKQTLEQLISTLDLYLKVYFYGSLALGMFGAMLPLLWKNVDIVNVELGKLIFICALFLILVPSYYFVTKWYIKKLYGNYVDELKLELKELEDLDE